MNLIIYIEHVLTLYETYYSRLDELFKEANIINYSNNNYRIIGFSFGDGSGYKTDLLHLHVIKKVYDKKKETEVDFYLPVEKISLFNRYTFDQGNICARNEEALLEAIELVKKDIFKSDINKRIQFYIDNKRITIETQFNGMPYIIITRYYGDYEKDSVTFYIKERKFVTDEYDYSFSELSRIEIPNEYLPKIFEVLYESRNLYLVSLTDEEKTIMCKEKPVEKRYESDYRTEFLRSYGRTKTFFDELFDLDEEDTRRERHKGLWRSYYED